MYVDCFMFSQIHTKKRNCLKQEKMNDLAFVMCNLKLTRKKNSKPVNYDFDDIESDDEWITEGMTNEECIEKEDDDLNENIVTLPIDVDLNADLNIEIRENDDVDGGAPSRDYNNEDIELEGDGDEDDPTFDDLC